MSKNYNKIGNFFAVMVLILAVLLLVGFATGNALLFWLLAILNLICGPVCLILYLIEVKRGVFAVKED